MTAVPLVLSLVSMSSLRECHLLFPCGFGRSERQSSSSLPALPASVPVTQAGQPSFLNAPECGLWVGAGVLLLSESWTLSIELDHSPPVQQRELACRGMSNCRKDKG